MANRDKKGRWKKGQSPNPGGLKPEERKAKRKVGEVARSILSASDTLKTNNGELKYPDKTRLEALFLRLYEYSMAKGDTHAARLLLEYAYGKPEQRIGGTDDGKPIEIRLVRGGEDTDKS